MGNNVLLIRDWANPQSLILYLTLPSLSIHVLSKLCFHGRSIPYYLELTQGSVQ